MVRISKMALKLLSIFFICLIIYLFISRRQFLYAFNTVFLSEPTIFSSFLSLSISVIGSVFGIFISVYYIIIQLLGKKPYSSFTYIFDNKNHLFVFLRFTIYIVFLIFTFLYMPYAITNREFFVFDIAILLILLCFVELINIFLFEAAITNSKSFVQFILRNFNYRNIKKFELLSVNSNVKKIYSYDIKLRMGGNGRYDRDPLEPFHQIIFEAMQTQDKGLLTICFDYFMIRICHINRVIYIKTISNNGLDFIKNKSNYFWTKYWHIHSNRNLLHDINITIVGLHFLVIRYNDFMNVWEIENNRKLIIVALGNLIYSLIRTPNNGCQVEYALYAILSINMIHHDIDLWGIYEPVIDILYHAELLKSKKEYLYCYDILLLITAYIELKTHFFVRSHGTKPQINSVPISILCEYKIAKRQMSYEIDNGKTLKELFPRNIWNDYISYLI